MAKVLYYKPEFGLIIGVRLRITRPKIQRGLRGIATYAITARSHLRDESRKNEINARVIWNCGVDFEHIVARSTRCRMLFNLPCEGRKGAFLERHLHWRIVNNYERYDIISGPKFGISIDTIQKGIPPLLEGELLNICNFYDVYGYNLS